MKKLKALALLSLAITGVAFADPICNSADDCFKKTDDAIGAKQFDKAFAYATVGCEKGSGDSCAAVGLFYQRGFGVEKNLTESLKYLEKSCHLGSGKGCATATFSNVYLNEKLGGQTNPKKGVEMATIGCDNDNALSCFVLGIAQIQGQGTKKNIDQGSASFDKACALDKETVCPQVQKVRNALLGK